MQNSDWSDFLYAACLIAVIFFVVGTIMLVLYIIRVICTSASLTTQDIESSARSESAKIEARSERERSLKSIRSFSTGKGDNRRIRRSKNRPSQRSTSLSQSEREGEPTSRRSTSLRSIPFQNAQGNKGQTLDVVFKKRDVKFSKSEHSSQEDEAFSEKKIKGVDIPKHTLRAGTLEEDEVLFKTRRPTGNDISRETTKDGNVDDVEKTEFSPKGIKGIVIPRETLRSGAAGEGHVPRPKAAPSITFNVEPGASISVNVFSGRARAGGGENEIAKSHTSSGTGTADVTEATASAILTET